MPMIEHLYIIDVEASDFGTMSDPIKVGITMSDSGNFCARIRPAQYWTHWDDEAEKIHRAPRDILETYGKPMREVADNLNKLLIGKTVYTDAWVVDKPWFITLFHGARQPMQLEASSLEMILSEP